MQTPESQIIINRFFAALAALKADKVIRGRQTFTRRYGINRWNLNTLEKNPESDMFQAAWLMFLVNDYGVSAAWLLTGVGEMFTAKKRKDEHKKVQPISTRQSEGGARFEAPVSNQMEWFDRGVQSGISC